MYTEVWSGFDIATCVRFLKSAQFAALHKIRSTSCTGYAYASLQSKLVRLGLLLEQVDFSTPAQRCSRTFLALLSLLLDGLEDLVLEEIRTSDQEFASAKAKLSILAGLQSGKGVAETAQYLDLEQMQDIRHASDVLDAMDAFLEVLARCERDTPNPDPIAPSESVNLQGDGNSWHILFDHLSKRLITCSTQHEVHQTRLFLGNLADQVDALRLLCSRSTTQGWHAVDFHLETSNKSIPKTVGAASQIIRETSSDNHASTCKLCNLSIKPPKYRTTKFLYNQDRIWQARQGVLLEESRRNPQLQSLETWLLGRDARRSHRKALQCILAQWLNCLYGTPWLSESWTLDTIWIDESLAKDGYRTPYAKCRSWQSSEGLPKGIPDAAFMIRFGILIVRIEFPEAIELLTIENEDNMDVEELDEYLQTLLEDERICDNIEVRLRDVLKVCQEWDDSSLPERRIVFDKIFAPLVEELRFRFSLDVPGVPERTLISQPEYQSTPPLFDIDIPGQVTLSPPGKEAQGLSILLYDDHNDPAEDRRVMHAKKFFERFDEYRGLHVNPALIQNRVKIAVLDTGINENCPSVRGRLAKIKGERKETHQGNPAKGAIMEKKSFVGGDKGCKDTCGHGTRVFDLLLRTAPNADYYIAKVSMTMDDKDPDAAGHVIDHNTDLLFSALDWAVGHKVDLINMSFGFERAPQDGKLQAKLLEVYGKGIKMFAAAANHGRNAPRSFPASAKEVIGVHASSGQGAWADDLNPSTTFYSDKWNTLGIGIEFVEGLNKTYRSGTSYATPVAVGIVANAIDVIRYLCAQEHLTTNQAQDFQTHSGIEKTMQLMSTDDFLAPWILWSSAEVIPQALAARLKWQGK